MNPDAQSEDVHGEQDDGTGDVLARHGRDRCVGAARRWLGGCSALSGGAALNCCRLTTRASHRPEGKCNTLKKPVEGPCSLIYKIPPIIAI